MEIRDWLKSAISALKDVAYSPRLDAILLMEMVLRKRRSWLLAFDEIELTPAQLSELNTYLQRRIEHEPIAYLTGQCEFWSLPLHVSSTTLVPRPDTEILVELALGLLPSSRAKVLDLGTGSGAVALAIASERRDCYIHGVDYNIAALSLARKNAISLGIDNVNFLYSSWFDHLDSDRYDLIVSNPPYIKEGDKHLLGDGVKFEPMSALVSGHDGLKDIEQIITLAPNWLKSGSFLVLEHGFQQGRLVRSLMHNLGYTLVNTTNDYSGNQRVTYGTLAQ